MIHMRPTLRSNFCYYLQVCFKRFKVILDIQEEFGSRFGAAEILTIIGVQKCIFLAKSENLTK